MFSHMDYLYEVYRQGSISKAAASLYISQPSLSASVKRVEDKIGYPLFDRSTRPLQLTEIGRKYMESVLAIRRIQKDFGDYVDDYGELKAGTVRLGGTNLVASLLAPGLIARFHQRYPQVDIQLQEEVTSELGDMLAEGQLDMVIDFGLSADDSFDYLKLTDEQLVLTVPRAFPVNEGLEACRLSIESLRANAAGGSAVPPVPLSRFKDVPFILLTEKNDTYRHTASLFRAAGFEPLSVFEAAQQMTAYHVCCSGYGAAFVSSLLLSRVTPDAGVYYYRLEDTNAFRQLAIHWKRDRYLSKAMQAFARTAVEAFEG